MSDGTEIAMIFHRAIEDIVVLPNNPSLSDAALTAPQSLAVLSSRLDGDVWDAELRVLDTKGVSACSIVLPSSASAQSWVSPNVALVGDDMGVLHVIKVQSDVKGGAGMKVAASKRLHDNIISAVTAIRDAENQCVTASWDKRVGLWDFAKGILTREFNGHEGQVNDIQVLEGTSPLIASAGSDAFDIATLGASVKLWDVRDSSDMPAGFIRTPTHATALRWLDPARDSNHILVGCIDGSCMLYDCRFPTEVAANTLAASGRHRSAERPVTKQVATLGSIRGPVRSISSFCVKDSTLTALAGDDRDLVFNAIRNNEITSTTWATAHTDYINTVKLATNHKSTSSSSEIVCWSGSIDKSIRVTAMACP